MREDLDELCGIQAVNEGWIRDLIRNLSRSVQISQVILFGSRALEEHTTWSDYDLCIVSPNFEGMKPWERMEMVLTHWNGERPLEVICYTPDEFKRLNTSLLEEIRNKGRALNHLLS